MYRRNDMDMQEVKLYTKDELIREATTFIEECYQELEKPSSDAKERIGEIKKEIEQTGTYEHTLEEIEHGAKMAWRNSNRCIGRLFWNTLHVFDERKQNSIEGVKEALYRHIDYASNEGRIRPTITIFQPEKAGKHPVRIWNHQLIRYAGYESEHGIIGDEASIPFTKVCEELGWEGNKTHFDVLPLVIEVDGETKWFNVPSEKIIEVPITHEEIPGFSDLNLKWYGVPMISDMKLEIGGIVYPAAPFNGWYMGTEIGARNLADENRYNLLPKVASLMGLNTSKASALWQDKALVELNVAVLQSFKQHGVSIVDHHTAAQQFKRFEQNEDNEGRDVTGDWTWLIPPVSPATTHIFHKSYNNRILNPNYYYQDKPY